GMDREQAGPVPQPLSGIACLRGSAVLSKPEAGKGTTFEVFRKLTSKLGLERPLILVLEDLHWIDKISEEFLGFLAENTPNARVLLLASYRPGHRPPWIDKSYAGQIPLQPLSRDDSIHVIRSVLRIERLIELLTEEIVVKGDG